MNETLSTASRGGRCWVVLPDFRPRPMPHSGFSRPPPTLFTPEPNVQDTIEREAVYDWLNERELERGWDDLP